MHADGAVEFLGERRFIRSAEIAAPLERQALLLQDLGGLVVGQARKRRLHVLEFAGVAVERLQLALTAFEDPTDDRDDERFREIHHVVERRVGDFGLDHPELGQVAPRLRFLGAKRRAKTVDAAERHRVGLVIELAALRQVRRFVVEVLDREEGCGSLARGRREDRRIGEDEAATVEEVTNRIDHFVADAQDRLLARRAQPEVTAVHQVVDAVFLRRDRIVLRFGDDLEPADIELEPAWRSRVRPRRPGDGNRALLRQVVGAREGVLADCRFRHDALKEPGAVAQRQEVNLSARTAIV